jgi:hypothetical protein
MSSRIINQMPYLRTSRNFPDDDMHLLTVEINKSYVDIANAVNSRTISLFPTNRPAQTGESFFITKNQRQQTLRQVYSFTSTTSINHGINVVDPSQFTSCYGTWTDGIDSYGLIFGTSVSIGGQISFYLTSTQIVFVPDAGAPALTQGLIVLQWLSQV